MSYSEDEGVDLAMFFIRGELFEILDRKENDKSIYTGKEWLCRTQLNHSNPGNRYHVRKVSS